MKDDVLTRLGNVRSAWDDLLLALHEDRHWISLAHIKATQGAAERNEELTRAIKGESHSLAPKARAQLSLCLAAISANLAGLGLILDDLPDEADIGSDPNQEKAS